MPEVIAWGIENRALQRVTAAAILIQASAAGASAAAPQLDMS